MSKNPIEFKDDLIQWLKQAKRVCVLTGAGISAESNIPTFRDAMTGLWAQYDPQELATPEAFKRDPKLVWDWYQWRKDLVADAKPNPGHLALVEMAKHVEHFTLITQNVDSLHQKAGSTDVLEMHGNISRFKCSRDGNIVETWPETEQVPPPCPQCSAHLRPDVVWFGESLDPSTLGAAIKASQTCDTFFSIGTSGLVQPAASLVFHARDRGAHTIEINPNATPQSNHVDTVLAAPSGVVLPELVAQVWG